MSGRENSDSNNTPSGQPINSGIGQQTPLRSVEVLQIVFPD